ncbi:hypothetical protein AAZX31_12G138000 [Glycine max]
MFNLESWKLLKFRTLKLCASCWRHVSLAVMDCLIGSQWFDFFSLIYFYFFWVYGSYVNLAGLACILVFFGCCNCYSTYTM